MNKNLRPAAADEPVQKHKVTPGIPGWLNNGRGYVGKFQSIYIDKKGVVVWFAGRILIHFKDCCLGHILCKCLFFDTAEAIGIDSNMIWCDPGTNFQNSNLMAISFHCNSITSVMLSLPILHMSQQHRCRVMCKMLYRFVWHGCEPNEICVTLELWGICSSGCITTRMK